MNSKSGGIKFLQSVECRCIQYCLLPHKDCELAFWTRAQVVMRSDATPVTFPLTWLAVGNILQDVITVITDFFIIFLLLLLLYQHSAGSITVGKLDKRLHAHKCLAPFGLACLKGYRNHLNKGSNLRHIFVVVSAFLVISLRSKHWYWYCFIVHGFRGKETSPGIELRTVFFFALWHLTL
jgi:hypothetical protein